MIEKNGFGWLMEHNDITNVNMKKRGCLKANICSRKLDDKFTVTERIRIFPLLSRGYLIVSDSKQFKE